MAAVGNQFASGHIDAKVTVFIHLGWVLFTGNGDGDGVASAKVAGGFTGDGDIAGFFAVLYDVVASNVGDFQLHVWRLWVGFNLVTVLCTCRTTTFRRGSIDSCLYFFISISNQICCWNI